MPRWTNGLLGTPDGKTLYITDHGGKKTYRYTVGTDGRLSDKKLFAPVGGDGMTIDCEGNVYLAEQAVLVFDASGRPLDTIPIPQRPTNLCFGSRDWRTLVITARKAVYSIRTRVAGVAPLPGRPATQP